jgi:hypothetical protein
MLPPSTWFSSDGEALMTERRVSSAAFGHVELLIGLDNKQWLPAHIEDSWDPDDDMRLMRSVFGHRYMITGGWGRDLLPPDNAPDSQAGAQGGAAEQADAAQEVQLPEYRGWSQGTWSP